MTRAVHDAAQLLGIEVDEAARRLVLVAHDRLALRLLEMHRQTAAEADSEMPAEDVDEIRQRIVQKLQRMKKRDAEEGEGRTPRSDVARDERAEVSSAVDAGTDYREADS